jgi:hypothetical protein
VRILNAQFQAKWRKSSKAKKWWQRFRSIAELVQEESDERGVPPSTVVAELEARRTTPNGSRMNINQLAALLDKERIKRVVVAGDVDARATEEGDGDTDDDDEVAADSTAGDVTRKRKAPLAPRTKVKKPRLK